MSKIIDSENQQQLSLDFEEPGATIKQYDLDKSNVINFNGYAKSRSFEIRMQTVEARLLQEAKKLRW